MTTYDVELVELPAQPAGVVRGHVDLAGLPGFLGGAFSEVERVLTSEHLAPAGPPFGRYQPTGDGGVDVAVGFPATGPVAPSGRVETVVLPGGTVARTLHRGDYSEVGAAYEAVTEWLAEHGYVPDDEPWESYLDEPGTPEPRTTVQVPCRRAG